MAYSATNLLAVRMKIEQALAGKMNQNELRRPQSGAWNSIWESTKQLIPGAPASISGLRQGSNAPVSIPILKQLSTTTGTVRKCGSGGEEGDSALVDVSWQTLSKDFSMSELLFSDNNIGYQTALEHNFFQVFDKLHRRLDVLGVAHLEANKSAVNAGTINTFNGASSEMQVALADEDRYFGSVLTEMMSNNFEGPYSAVHSLNANLAVSRLQAQGAGNSTNQQWQFGDFSHYLTKNVTDGTGDKFTSYFYVPGTVGVVPWINPLHRANRVSGPDTWTTIADPFVPGLVWELKIKTGCTDNSGVAAGREADLTTQFVLSADFAFMKAYTSNTDTGIYKYRQKKA